MYSRWMRRTCFRNASWDRLLLKVLGRWGRNASVNDDGPHVLQRTSEAASGRLQRWRRQTNYTDAAAAAAAAKLVVDCIRCAEYRLAFHAICDVISINHSAQL